MRFEVDAILDEKSFKYSISFEVQPNAHEASVAEEGLSVEGTWIFQRRQSEVVMYGHGLPFGIDRRSAALPVINERPGRSSIEQLRSFFSSMILIAPIPSNMSGFSEEESLELHEDAGNFSSWFNALIVRYPSVYGAIEGYLRTVIPDFDSLENVPRGEKGKQLFVKFCHQELNRKLSIDFKHLSDGEKCFFLCAAVLASGKVRQPVFCMWDEPDSHLSISETDHFITQLRKMSAKGNSQLIATSHHPQTIRSFSDETTLVFTRKSHLEPTVVRSSPI